MIQLHRRLLELKDVEVERQAREIQVQSIENLKKKLAEAKEETTSLRHQLYQQADNIQMVWQPFLEAHVFDYSLFQFLFMREFSCKRNGVCWEWKNPVFGRLYMVPVETMCMHAWVLVKTIKPSVHSCRKCRCMWAGGSGEGGEEVW